MPRSSAQWMTWTAFAVSPWVRNIPSPPRPRMDTSLPVRPKGRLGSASMLLPPWRLSAEFISVATGFEDIRATPYPGQDVIFDSIRWIAFTSMNKSGRDCEWTNLPIILRHDTRDSGTRQACRHQVCRPEVLFLSAFV